MEESKCTNISESSEIVKFSQTDFIGHRGTSKEWGKNCEINNFYFVSTKKNEYLGHGIYFFENDFNEAYNWAHFNRGIHQNDVAVIVANISTDKVYDLIDRETHNAYIKILSIIHERFKQTSRKPNSTHDCTVINDICSKKGYKLVRGFIQCKSDDVNRLIKENATHFIKGHIQLCVRDPEIIMSKKVIYGRRSRSV